MREIRTLSAGDYKSHTVNLTDLYGSSVPTADAIVDDLRAQGFEPTFEDEPIGNAEYMRCGNYDLPRRPDGVVLRRNARFLESAYSAELEIAENCKVVGLSAGREPPITL